MRVHLPLKLPYIKMSSASKNELVSKLKYAIKFREINKRSRPRENPKRGSK